MIAAMPPLDEPAPPHAADPRPPSARAPRSRRADYVRFLPLTLRLLENDIYGHVNNAHYYSLFDTTVCEFLAGHGMLGTSGADHLVMMAESGCRYHSELKFPDRIEGAVRVDRLSERSIRYAVAVFRAGAETASADGFMVHVCVDATTRRPAPLPARWREVLRTLMKDA